MAIISRLRPFALFILNGAIRTVCELKSSTIFSHNNSIIEIIISLINDSFTIAAHSTLPYLDLRMVNWLNSKPFPIWTKALLATSVWLPTKAFSKWPAANKIDQTLAQYAGSLITYYSLLFYMHDKRLCPRNIHHAVLLVGCAGISSLVSAYLNKTFQPSYSLKLFVEYTAEALPVFFLFKFPVHLADFAIHRSSIASK